MTLRHFIVPLLLSLSACAPSPEAVEPEPAIGLLLISTDVLQARVIGKTKP